MEIVILILSAFISSAISAVIGMGGGVVLLGIMALIIPEGYMVIALHGVIQLVSNTTRTYIFRKYLNKNIIKIFFIGAIIGLCISAYIIYILTQFFEVSSANEIKTDFLKPIIGVFIIWYLFLKKSLTIENTRSFFYAGGLSGLSTVFIGATGPLIAPFFLNNQFNKNVIIANKAACQMITHFFKIPLFVYFFNVNYIENYYILLPLIIAVFFGTNLGKKILGFIPEQTFRKLFKMVLFIIAITLILNN